MTDTLPKKKNILFAIGSLDIGGAERQMAALIRHLHNRRFLCHIFVFQNTGPLRRSLEEFGVTICEGGLKKGDIIKAPWKLIWAEWKLLLTVIRLKPLVVHSFLPMVTFMGALAGRIAKVPLVVTSRRALGKHQERYVILRPFDILAHCLSHRVTVNSMAVWEDTVHRDHIDPKKLVLIYNGVDTPAFDYKPSYREHTRKQFGFSSVEPIIIVVANLIPYKGHKELLSAAQQVLKKIPQSIFLLAGEDRGIGGDLKKMAMDLGIARKVHFLSLRYDISRLMAASDLSVVSSYEEGFSNVILESMAAGLPIVATNVGGNSEAIVHGVTGWLVPPKSPAAMAEKIIDLLQDPQKARSWGKQGRERVKKNFNIERMVQEHIELYEGKESDH